MDCIYAIKGNKKKQNYMKQIILMLLFLITPLCYSQNLIFDQFLVLQKKNFATVEEFLTLKEWSFIGGEKPINDKLGMMNFAYKKSTYNDNATSFMSYIFNATKTICRVNIQLHDEKKYLQYLNRVKTLGFKLVDSKFEDGNIKKIYKGSTMTIIVLVETYNEEHSFSTKNRYHFIILTNSDYKLNYTTSEEYTKTIANITAADTAAVYNGN